MRMSPATSAKCHPIEGFTETIDLHHNRPCAQASEPQEMILVSRQLLYDTTFLRRLHGYGVRERVALGLGQNELCALLPALLDVDEVEEDGA